MDLHQISCRYTQAFPGSVMTKCGSIDWKVWTWYKDGVGAVKTAALNFLLHSILVNHSLGSRATAQWIPPVMGRLDLLMKIPSG